MLANYTDSGRLLQPPIIIALFNLHKNAREDPHLMEYNIDPIGM